MAGAKKICMFLKVYGLKTQIMLFLEFFRDLIN